MAAGDSFTNLLAPDDQAPPPQLAPLSTEPGELEQAAALKKQQKGQTVIGGPFATQTMSDANAAAFFEQEAPKLEKRRRAEALGINAGAAEQKKSDVLKANFGTDDPQKAAQIKATGVFDPDFKERMQMDPQGGKAAYDRAMTILGKSGAQAGPQGTAEPRQFSEGVGLHGERYFTNLSEGELYAEHAPVKGIVPGPVSSGALKPYQPGGAPTPSDTDAAGKSPADILFQGKVAKADMIAGAPERDAKYLNTLSEKHNELLDMGKKEGGQAAVAEVQKLLMSGFFKQPKDAARMEAALVKHAYPPAVYAGKRLTDPLAMPWTKGGLPGKAADQAEPASVLNPGGAKPAMDTAQQQSMMALSDQAQHLEDSKPKESTTTADWARMSPVAERLKGVAAKQKEERRQGRIKEFGFDYEPPTIGGYLKSLVGRGE